MHQENNDLTLHKRTLKKVRRQFLHKNDDPEEAKNVDPATKLLTEDKTFVLKATVGLVEVNRKIYSGPQYLNPHFKLTSSVIEVRPSNKILRLNLAENRDNIPLPWEYVMKRLESYGDLELVTMGKRIEKFYSKFKETMSKYEESLQSNHPVIKKLLSETTEKATKACEEVEKNKMFYKVLFHFTKDSDQILATCYSEGLLEAIGHKTENFVKHLEVNGLPTIFDPDCLAFQHAVKLFLNFTVFTSGPVYELPEYDTFLYDSKGAKSKIKVQTVSVLEPVSDGILAHFYFVVKNGSPSNPECNKKCIISESDMIDTSSKCIKIDSEKGQNEHVAKDIAHEMTEKRM